MTTLANCEEGRQSLVGRIPTSGSRALSAITPSISRRVIASGMEAAGRLVKITHAIRRVGHPKVSAGLSLATISRCRGRFSASVIAKPVTTAVIRSAAASSGPRSYGSTRVRGEVATENATAGDAAETGLRSAALAGSGRLPITPPITSPLGAAVV